MPSDISGLTVRLIVAVLKHQAENVLGKEALDIAGDEIQQILDKTMQTPEGAKEVLAAAQRADSYFRKKCRTSNIDIDLQGAFSIPWGDLPSIQIALTTLPMQLDEDELLAAIREDLGRDLPNLPREKIDVAATLYMDSLNRALLPIEKFSQTVIGHSVLEIRESARQLLKEMRTIKAGDEEIRAKLGEVLERLSFLPVHGGNDYFARTYGLHLTDSPTQFSTPASVRNILERSTKPPFGGREAELARIDGFLHEHKSGYIFVTGSSGIGKTTLLGHVIRRYSARNNTICTYYFLSRKDDTASESQLLRGVCRQLADSLGFAGYLPEDIPSLRALYQDLLTRPVENDRQLMVVIDGLDEADAWIPGRNICPMPLPAGVFVLLAARKMADRDWTGDLDLPRDSCVINLGALDPDGIVQAFKSAGGRASDWIAQEDFRQQVVRVSAGDPFYVRCLLEDIERGEATPENVGSKPKSLDGYLDQWWRAVVPAIEEPTVRDLLGYLAVARGPIGIGDLAKVDPADSLTAFTLLPTLTKVQRFVVGDWATGYSLCHPRFQDFIVRRLGPALTEYEDKLIGYCAGPSDGRGEYALRHLASHYAQRRQFGKLNDLLMRPEYMRAKRAKGGSYYSYIQEVTGAIEVCEGQGMAGLPQLAFYSLLVAVLRTQTANIAPEVLRILAEWGRLESAVSYARSIADPQQRTLAFQMLGGGGWDPRRFFGVPSEQRERLLPYDTFLLQCAFEESQRIPRRDERLQLLSGLCVDLARSGDAKTTLLCLQELKRWSSKDDDYIGLLRNAQHQVPAALASAGDKANALLVIDDMDGEYEKDQALRDVARTLADSRKIKEALEIAIDNIEKKELVDSVALGLRLDEKTLLKILRAIAQLPDRETRESHVAEIESQIHDLHDEARVAATKDVSEGQSRWAIADKARLMAWIARGSEALSLLRSLGENKFWMYSTDWVRTLAVDLLIEGAEADVQFLLDNGWIDHWFGEALPICREALSEFESVDENDQKLVLSRLVPRLNKREVWPAAEAVAARLVASGKMHDVWECFDLDHNREYSNETVLSEVATHLARMGRYGEAERLISRFDDHYLDRSFSDLAGALMGCGRQREVLPVAKRLMRSPAKRCKAVAFIADAYAHLEKDAATLLLDEALMDAETPVSPRRYRSTVIAEFAKCLLTDGSVEQARELARTFVSSAPYEYAETTSIDIVARSSADQMKSQLSQALDWIKASCNHEEQQRALCHLAISLAHRQQLDLAEMTLQEIDKWYWPRACVLAVIAGKTATTNMVAASDLLDRALQMVQALAPSANELPPHPEPSTPDGEELETPNGLPELPERIPEAEALPGLAELSWFLSPIKPALAASVWDSWSTRELLEYAGREPSSEDLLFAVSRSLVAAGWIERAVQLAGGSKETYVREDLDVRAAMGYAALGDFDKALASYPHPDSEPGATNDGQAWLAVILKILQFAHLVQARDFDAATFAAESIVRSYAAAGALESPSKDDERSSERSHRVAEMFEKLVLGYADQDHIAGIQKVLEWIPDRLPYITLMQQINCVTFFLRKKKINEARTVAAWIQDEPWKDVAKGLIRGATNTSDPQQRNLDMLSALRHLRRLGEATAQPVVATWLSSITKVIAIDIGEFDDVLSVLSEFGYSEYTSGLDDEVVVRLAYKGYIDAASTLLARVLWWRVNPGWHERHLIKNISSALMDLPPQDALKGIHLILLLARLQEFEAAYEFVADIAPVIHRHGGAEASWGVSSTILKLDEFWL